MVFYFVSMIDCYSKIIPNRLIIILLGISLFRLTINFYMEYVLASGVIFIVLIVVNYYSSKIFEKTIFGWGDVKLIGMLGLYLGWQVLWVAYIAMIFLGLLSIIGVVLKKINRSTRIPLAVFLFLGYLFLRQTDLKVFYFLTGSCVISLVNSLISLLKNLN
ncbi:MAG: A24 family peptidase [Balneolaceae bacterium]